MANRSGRISDLLGRARERPAGERPAFIREAAGGDEAIVRVVEALLASEAGVPELQNTPVPAGSQAPFDLAGRRLGAYELVAPLGGGGMGVVYRATDRRLGRDVAIKLLPPHLTSSRQRRARFAREARVLASISHPHIGAIYGVEEGDGVSALVLELCEGPTLADCLARGPLPLRPVLTIARQIADALDAAHQHGIVHRDLKPENIVVRGVADGRHWHTAEPLVKVVDFGLAKTVGAAVENAETGTGRQDSTVTVDGRIVGSPAYMSPEQARGEAVDRRTDIWAFGCVLFEMLSGRPAFAGATTTDTLANVLARDPDWARLPPDTPAEIRTLLRRCLCKDAHQRLRDIADARLEIEDVQRPDGEIDKRRIRRRSALRRERLAWTVAGLTSVAGIALALVGRQDGRPQEPVQFAISMPEGTQFSETAPHFAMSPDGRHLAFAAASRQGPAMIFVRTLASEGLRVLPGTEGAVSPFWSPDSTLLGFFAGGHLKTVPLSGGLPAILQTVRLGNTPSGAWSADDTIVFGPRDGALWQVSARPGAPPPVLLTRPTDDEIFHRWPAFLPDGRRFLYLVQKEASTELRVGTLGREEFVSLGGFESNAAFAAGHLFFVRGGNLAAQRFDPSRLKLSGRPIVVAPETAVDPHWQRGLFSVSGSGTVAYSGQARTQSVLTWVGRDGRELGTIGEPGTFFNFDLTSDGRYIAASKLTQMPGARAEFDIWLIDRERAGGATRLTDHPAWEFDPAWSRDGRFVAFNSNRPTPGKSPFGLFVRAVNGRQDTLLLTGADTVSSPAWSPDGRTIVFVRTAQGTRQDLWTVPSAGGAPEIFLQSGHVEAGPSFSPDGRWIAYESDVSGRMEVYMRRYQRPDGVVPISRDGGWATRWRSDGKELFFLSADGSVMAVAIDVTSGVPVGMPVPLFRTTLRRGNNRPYAVSADGQRFLIPRTLPAASIAVVVNPPALVGSTMGR